MSNNFHPKQIICMVYFFLCILTFLHTGAYGATITITPTDLDEHTKNVNIAFNLHEKESVYHDSITLSVDHPHLSISPWHTSQTPSGWYDPVSKQTKKTYRDALHITCCVNTQEPIDDDTYLHITYELVHGESIQHMTHQLTCASIKPNTEQAAPVATTNAVHDAAPHTYSPLIAYLSEWDIPWNVYYAYTVDMSHSLWFKMLIVLLFGLLTSFTPFVYPMIPVTAGILLRSNKKRPLWRKAITIMAYTCGLATMLGLFGLATAAMGQWIGSAYAHMLRSLYITILWYIGCSMIGLYALYTPRFLHPQQTKLARSTVGATFLFGAATSSIALPLIAPSLIPLLTFIATWARLSLGFGLVFAFGVGISIPLTIMSMCTHPSRALPRPGSWLHEVQTLSGFVLLALSFYYLNAIVSLHILISLITLFCISTGVFYIYTSAHTASSMWRIIKNSIGIILIALSIVLITVTAKEIYIHLYEDHHEVTNKPHTNN